MERPHARYAAAAERSPDSLPEARSAPIELVGSRLSVIVLLVIILFSAMYLAVAEARSGAERGRGEEGGVANIKSVTL